MFSEPENSMFLQFTGSHRLQSGPGLFRFTVWPALAMEGGGERDKGDVMLQVPCAIGTLGSRTGWRHHSCPDENQMAQKDDSCAHSWKSG